MIRRIGLVVFLAVVALVPFMSAFYLNLGSYIGLYAITAIGLVLLAGVAGLISFGQAAFMGLGAYTTAVLTLQLHWSPWVTLIIGLAITVAVSLLLGEITLRMGGHFLPLATIAWGYCLYLLFGHIPGLGGYTGLTDIPPLSFFHIEVRSPRTFYYIIWVVVLGAGWISLNLLNSREGRAIRALKTNVPMAEAFGANTIRLKTFVFVYSAMLACVSGWLYAHMELYVNPSPFSLGQGITFIFMITIGGAGSVWGAVIGATLITVLENVLRGLLPQILGQTGNYEEIVFGIMMVAVLQGMRGGIWFFIERLLPAKPNPKIDETSNLPARVQPQPGEVLLKVDSARKEFGGLVAVKNVSFEVCAGEIVGLIGPNGAGKTTMFNLISGELPRTAGEIYFSAHRISDLSSHHIARHGLARTFQHVKLISDMSVIDNVMLGAYLRTHDGVVKAGLRLNRSADARVRAEAAKQLRRVGLEDSMFLPTGSLPLGKQRIVEIARALCADPIMILLDESAAGLRYFEKEVLAKLLRTLRSEGLTVLIVEHDMDFLMNLVDRVVVMEFGKKLAEGLPLEIGANPEVVEAYLGGV